MSYPDELTTPTAPVSNDPGRPPRTAASPPVNGKHHPRARPERPAAAGDAAAGGVGFRAAAGAEPDPRLDDCHLLTLYRAMRTARTVNVIENELATSGEAFFYLPTMGHESSAAWNLFLRPADWLFMHYRNKALWLARGTEPKAFFDSILTNADNYSHGRHMCGFPASADANMPVPVVPVGNSVTHAVGCAAQLIDDLPDDTPPADRPLVYCSMGDGTTQQGEVYEGIFEAVRRRLPVLFVIEDNGYAISTPTAGATFFDLPSWLPNGGPAKDFLGLPIHRFDGRDVMHDLPAMGRLVDHVRGSASGGEGGPGLCVIRHDRLSSHTNADDHRVYRDADEIERLKQTADPTANFRRSLLHQGVKEADLDAIDAEVEQKCRHQAELSRRVGDPTPTFTAKRDLPPHLHPTAPEYRGRPASAGRESAPTTTPPDSPPTRLTMIESMRAVLAHRLATDPRVFLTGEDIEDPKGDVFGVTRGLSTAFPSRVVNAALSEPTIIGGSIGRALAGGKPVGFIQFADFLPNGISQIMSELGSMYWRTAGMFECPVILMVTCGGYRAGLGPFHAQTFESMLAHIPGVDVLMPATAGDAAGLLNAAFDSNRPTVFLYPKVCLNDRNATTSADVETQLVPLGKARQITSGGDLTLVAWGSTVPIAQDVVKTIHDQTDARVDLFDLRSIDPWDRDAIAASARRTGKLLIVHEDNLTAGFGAEVLASVTEDFHQTPPGHPASAGWESASPPSPLKPLLARRVTRPDTYVPCNYPNQLEVLPSYKRTLQSACDLLNLQVTFGHPASAGWESPDTPDTPQTITAQGSAPTDQIVTVSKWHVAPGDTVTTGQLIADMEADKAVFEFSSPTPGTVHALLANPGDELNIGDPLLQIQPPAPQGHPASAGWESASQDSDQPDDPLSKPIVRRPSREDYGNPVITPPSQLASPASAGAPPTQKGVAPVRVGGRAVRCYLTPIHYAEGNDRLTNADLVRRFPHATPDDIIRRTGIVSRPYCDSEQSALSLAIDAATKALTAENLTLDDLTGIVCHTTTPPVNTPSMACMLLNALDPSGAAELMVYDVNAACSGWLYALDAAHNTIQHNPDSAVLVVTTECLSRVVNPEDFDTAILFGDAATATIMRGSIEDPPQRSAAAPPRRLPTPPPPRRDVPLPTRPLRQSRPQTRPHRRLRGPRPHHHGRQTRLHRGRPSHDQDDPGRLRPLGHPPRRPRLARPPPGQRTNLRGRPQPPRHPRPQSHQPHRPARQHLLQQHPPRPRQVRPPPQTQPNRRPLRLRRRLHLRRRHLGNGLTCPTPHPPHPTPGSTSPGTPATPPTACSPKTLPAPASPAPTTPPTPR